MLMLICKVVKHVLFNHVHYSTLRGAGVVRAARLQRRKLPFRVSSRLGFAMRQLENSLCQPSSKWVPFSN